MPDRQLTLDPGDWSTVRALGHRMLDDMFAHLEGIRGQPAWREMPAEAKEAFDVPLPTNAQGIETAYRAFLDHVLPYTAGNVHPRFWGWVKGSGSVEGMLAELLTAGLNVNAGGFDIPATYVELQVLAWCRTMMGFPAASGAAIVSGDRWPTSWRWRPRAMRWEVRPRRRDFAPSRRHSPSTARIRPTTRWRKSLRLLGLGREALRTVPTNAAFQLDLAALDRMIAEDRGRGVRPGCVIGNAGTVNTGATDDLVALAAVCRREGMWFHVDGAFGAVAMLSPSLRPIVNGLEQADSLAFDFHKWLHVQYDAGCVLVRDAESHRKPFSEPASYLKWMDRGFGAGPAAFRDYAPELSREFRALKIWMAFMAHGIDQYRRLAEQNVAQAAYLTELVEKDGALELLAPTALNIVCFRYCRPGLDNETLNGVNQEILMRLQEEGVAVPSGTMLHGKFAIRCAITNHRSRWEDFDLLTGAVLRLGETLTIDD